MVEKPDERLLPTNKVRTIMKSCGDPSAFLSKESVLVVTKAAELFISYLTQQTLKKCAHKKDLNYNDLSNFVQEEEKLEFLHQIVPKKITVKEFREILERGSESEDSDDDESESENSDDGEEVEEEEDDDESASDASEDGEDGEVDNDDGAEESDSDNEAVIEQ